MCLEGTLDLEIGGDKCQPNNNRKSRIQRTFFHGAYVGWTIDLTTQNRLFPQKLL